MLLSMCRAKIQGASVTDLELNYEGSITIDADLLRESGILPGERVQVLNLNNGARVETYVIEGRAASGRVIMNGPAARAAQVGDKVIIVAYGLVEAKEARGLRSRVVSVDEKNRILRDKK